MGFLSQSSKEALLGLLGNFCALRIKTFLDPLGQWRYNTLGKGKFSLWFFWVRVKVGFKNSELVSRAHIWPNLSSFFFYPHRRLPPLFLFPLPSLRSVPLISLQSGYSEAHMLFFYDLHSEVLCLLVFFFFLQKSEQSSTVLGNGMWYCLSAIRIFNHMALLVDTGWPHFFRQPKFGKSRVQAEKKEGSKY